MNAIEPKTIPIQIMMLLMVCNGFCLGMTGAATFSVIKETSEINSDEREQGCTIAGAANALGAAFVQLFGVFVSNVVIEDGISVEVSGISQTPFIWEWDRK